MEFRLLGPIEVVANGTLVPLGGAKPKALLAALLLDHGRVVPINRLVDILWGESPPRTARDVIQTYIKSLRRSLAQHGITDVIITESPGYAARLPAESIDHHVFDGLILRARRAGEPEMVSDLLTEALSLWRGSAFCGLGDGLLAGEAHRLDELRLRAHEERITADLALGRHDQLVPELTGLIARYSTNERLRSQLMIALHRQGRQSDALAIYREGRETLIEELGLEPGNELRATHSAILQDDPALHSSVFKDSAVPCQLPLVPADFTGRAGEIESLTDGLTSRPQVVAGAGGVGKSTLAARVARQAAASYPDGQLYAELHGMSDAPAEPGEVLGRFLRALGTPASRLPDAIIERAELYRTTLAGRRVLVVLDDASNEEQVRQLLPGGANCAVIITSRSRLTGLPGVTLTELDILCPGDALDLLDQFVGQDRVNLDRESSESIVQHCGRLPLAIRIAAARLTSRKNLPLRWLADRLNDESRRLNELTVGDMGVRASIGLSYDGLDTREQMTLRRLGYFGVPEISLSVAEWLTELPREDAERSVEMLVDAQLLEFTGIGWSGSPRYRMHDLVRIYTRERAELEDAREDLTAAVSRAVIGWLTLIRQTVALLPDDGNRWQHALADIPAVSVPALADPRAWFEAEQPAIAAGVERAAALGMHELVCAFGAEQFWTLFAGAGRFDLRDRIIDAVLSAARQAGDVRSEAAMLADAGQLRYMQDQFVEARLNYSEALARFRKLGDVPRQIAALAGLGTSCRESGRLAEAIHFLNQALELLEGRDDDISRGYVLRLCGSVRLEQGQYAAAHSDLEDALAAYRRVGSSRGEALTLRTMALYQRATGDLEQALALGVESRDIFRELGDEYLEAYAVRAIVKTLVRLGRGDEQLEQLEWALSVCQRAHDRWGQGVTLRALGELHLARQRLDLAETFLDAAMSIWETMDAPLWTARTQHSLSQTYRARAEADQAQESFQRAVKAFHDCGAREYGELKSHP